jgi:hypothetical protein
MIAKMAGYAFRLRSLSYGGQVGSNPPCDLAGTKAAVVQLRNCRLIVADYVGGESR